MGDVTVGKRYYSTQDQREGNSFQGRKGSVESNVENGGWSFETDSE